MGVFHPAFAVQPGFRGQGLGKVREARTEQERRKDQMYLRTANKPLLFTIYLLNPSRDGIKICFPERPTTHTEQCLYPINLKPSVAFLPS